MLPDVPLVLGETCETVDDVEELSVVVDVAAVLVDVVVVIVDDVVGDVTVDDDLVEVEVDETVVVDVDVGFGVKVLHGVVCLTGSLGDRGGVVARWNSVVGYSQGLFGKGSVVSLGVTGEVFFCGVLGAFVDVFVNIAISGDVFFNTGNVVWRLLGQGVLA